MLTCADEISLCACSEERFHGHISRGCLKWRMKNEGKVRGGAAESAGVVGVSSPIISATFGEIT